MKYMISYEIAICIVLSVLFNFTTGHAQSHVTRMTFQKLTNWGNEIFVALTIFSWSLIHQLLFFFKHLLYFTRRAFYFKGEVEILFRLYLPSKPLEFYHTGINNLITRLQKCIDFHGSHFQWFRHYLRFILKSDLFYEHLDSINDLFCSKNTISKDSGCLIVSPITFRLSANFFVEHSHNENLKFYSILSSIKKKLKWSTLFSVMFFPPLG